MARVSVKPTKIVGKRAGDAISWIELWGGPGDGLKRKRIHFPAVFHFPDDFMVEVPFPDCVYEKWEPVLTVIEETARPTRVVTAVLYVFKDTLTPYFRRTQYRRLKG